MIITLYAESGNGRLKYYTIHDRQPSLDCPYTLTAAWRSEGSRERERRYEFRTAQERDRKVRELFRRTVRKGYRLLYSFSRDERGRFGKQRLDPFAVREPARASSDAL